jgi:hypothetical protein
MRTLPGLGEVAHRLVAASRPAPGRCPGHAALTTKVLRGIFSAGPRFVRLRRARTLPTSQAEIGRHQPTALPLEHKFGYGAAGG